MDRAMTLGLEPERLWDWIVGQNAIALGDLLSSLADYQVVDMFGPGPDSGRARRIARGHALVLVWRTPRLSRTLAGL